MEEGSNLDWKTFGQAGADCRYMELLAKIPVGRWAERDDEDNTLLHYACCGLNDAAIVALVQSKLVDVNARNVHGITPAHVAAAYKQHRTLEMLCAMGANMKASGDHRPAVIDAALNAYGNNDTTLQILIANGIRLSTAYEYFRFQPIMHDLHMFERGVLRCRTAIVAMIHVKKAGSLWRWDKFLLREIAFAIWSTRYDHVKWTQIH